MKNVGNLLKVGLKDFWMPLPCYYGAILFFYIFLSMSLPALPPGEQIRMQGSSQIFIAFSIISAVVCLFNVSQNYGVSRQSYFISIIVFSIVMSAIVALIDTVLNAVGFVSINTITQGTSFLENFAGNITMSSLTLWAVALWRVLSKKWRYVLVGVLVVLMFALPTLIFSGALFEIQFFRVLVEVLEDIVLFFNKSLLNKILGTVLILAINYGIFYLFVRKMQYI